MNNSSNSNIYVKCKVAHRCDIASAVMQQVQRCPWSPFKMNEIVTLERCLQTASLDDPRMGLILGKLANESVFVEPRIKVEHLERNNDRKRADKELERKARSLMDAVADISKETEHYLSKLRDLTREQAETNSEIGELEKSILLWEENNNIFDGQFGCLLDLVLSSFERSMEAIKFSIPNFIASIPDSELVKQFDLLGARYRSCLIAMARQSRGQQPQQSGLAQQLSHRQMKLMIRSLDSYAASIANLYRDLVSIHRAYSVEVSEELEHFEALRAHLEFLKRPLADVPKLSRVVHCQQRPMALVEELPEHIGEPAEKCDDSEFIDMMSRLTAKLRLNKNCLKNVSINREPSS